jgi:quercetin 2,3-dioxygenase
MKNIRRISKIKASQAAIDGAGVRLKRAFGNADVPLFDPFLLLDDFHSNNPDDYIAGFPSHPHRGIETVTYVLSGQVKHKDSTGSSGIIGAGDLQWMTAGSGIIHSEMPQRVDDELRGLQLWVNLPAANKMMPPRYQEVRSEKIPTVTLDSGIKIKVICGQIKGTQGPIQDIVVDPEYLDITIPDNTIFEHDVKKDYTVFAYVLDGNAYFDVQKEQQIPRGNLVLFDKGDSLNISTTGQTQGVRVLLVSGKPIGEPVAWYGPMVMNTEEELHQAFQEYQDGTFVK